MVSFNIFLEMFGRISICLCLDFVAESLEKALEVLNTTKPQPRKRRSSGNLLSSSGAALPKIKKVEVVQIQEKMEIPNVNAGTLLDEPTGNLESSLETNFSEYLDRSKRIL